MAPAAPITLRTVITIQGVNAVSRDLIGNGIFALRSVPLLVHFSGSLLVNLAREIHRPHILTGETFESIGISGEGLHQTGFGGQGIDVGFDTEQGALQEFGFLHPTAGWIINPFLIPAFDTVAPLFEDGMVQIAEVMAGRRHLEGIPAIAAQPALDSVRSLLYSASKFAGDIAVLGFGGLSRFRTGALKSAQLLGDISAGIRGAIGQRLSVRATGRWVQGSLTASATGFVTGPSPAYTGSAQRIYNRISGSISGRGLSSVASLGR